MDPATFHLSQCWDVTQKHIFLWTCAVPSDWCLKDFRGRRGDLWVNQHEVANSSIHANHHSCQCFVRVTQQLLFTDAHERQPDEAWGAPCLLHSKDIKLTHWLWHVHVHMNNYPSFHLRVRMRWFLNSSQTVHIWVWSRSGLWTDKNHYLLFLPC